MRLQTRLPIVLVGYPGAGKTSVALHVATRRIQQRNEAVELLHTDRLKVTARHGGHAPPGAAWRHEAQLLAEVYGPLLDAHVDDASRKGLRLVIEGTLAAFVTRPAHRMHLVCDDKVQRRRNGQKPEPLQAAISSISEEERRRMTTWFSDFRPERIDASAGAIEVASAVDAYVQAAEETAP